MGLLHRLLISALVACYRDLEDQFWIGSLVDWGYVFIAIAVQ